MLQRLAIIPRHPDGRILGQFAGVVLQFGEVMEGIGVIQFTGMNEAHVEIAHVGAAELFSELQQGLSDLEPALNALEKQSAA